MSEPKEIPQPILDAAANALLNSRTADRDLIADAKAALKAADVPKMLARITELEASLNSIRRHTNPDGKDGTYRFDSANDACDFAFAEAVRAMKSAGGE